MQRTDDGGVVLTKTETEALMDLLAGLSHFARLIYEKPYSKDYEPENLREMADKARDLHSEVVKIACADDVKRMLQMSVRFHRGGR